MSRVSEGMLNIACTAAFMKHVEAKFSRPIGRFIIMNLEGEVVIRVVSMERV